MKKIRQTALAAGILFLVVMATALLLPATYSGAQTVVPSGGGGGSLPPVPTATLGISPAEATQTAIAQGLPLTGSAAATATALAQGAGPLPTTGQPTNVLGYVLLIILVGFALIMAGLWLRRRRAHRLQ
jgi:hypothetical protein